MQRSIDVHRDSREASLPTHLEMPVPVFQPPRTKHGSSVRPSLAWHMSVHHTPLANRLLAHSIVMEMRVWPHLAPLAMFLMSLRPLLTGRLLLQSLHSLLKVGDRSFDTPQLMHPSVLQTSLAMCPALLRILLAVYRPFQSAPPAIHMLVLSTPLALCQQTIRTPLTLREREFRFPLVKRVADQSIPLTVPAAGLGSGVAMSTQALCTSLAMHEHILHSPLAMRTLLPFQSNPLPSPAPVLRTHLSMTVWALHTPQMMPKPEAI